jgi:hypothetical protein
MTLTLIDITILKTADLGTPLVGQGPELLRRNSSC